MTEVTHALVIFEAYILIIRHRDIWQSGRLMEMTIRNWTELYH